MEERTDRSVGFLRVCFLNLQNITRYKCHFLMFLNSSGERGRRARPHVIWKRQELIPLI